ncbi:hypothetical protein [Fibrella aquatica]
MSIKCGASYKKSPQVRPEGFFYKIQTGLAVRFWTIAVRYEL